MAKWKGDWSNRKMPPEIRGNRKNKHNQRGDEDNIEQEQELIQQELDGLEYEEHLRRLEEVGRGSWDVGSIAICGGGMVLRFSAL